MNLFINKSTNFNKSKNILGEVINYRTLRDIMHAWWDVSHKYF